MQPAAATTEVRGVRFPPCPQQMNMADDICGRHGYSAGEFDTIDR